MDTNLTLLDVSEAAIEIARRRLGDAAEAIHWLCVDVTKAGLPPQAYDVWHDRAVFHFLTDQKDRLIWASGDDEEESPQESDDYVSLAV